MLKMTLNELACATGGRILRGCPDLPSGDIVTDTRHLAAGEFFIPLSGRRFDGHDFLCDALRVFDP